MAGNLKHFRFWCQKVLPLVYDNSLSYYEVLCKVVDYINKLIDSDKEIVADIAVLREEMDEVLSFMEKYREEAEKIIKEEIEKYIATMVFFGITGDGYFVAYIPESWDDITFYTTELDIFLPLEPEYGHLVLAY